MKLIGSTVDSDLGVVGCSDIGIINLNKNMILFANTKVVLDGKEEGHFYVIYLLLYVESKSFSQITPPELT